MHPTSGSGHAFTIEPFRDTSERLPLRMLGADPFCHEGVDADGSSEPHSLSTFDRQGIFRSRADDPPFPLGCARHDGGEKFSRWGPEVDAEVERDEVPALIMGGLPALRGQAWLVGS